VNERSEAVLSEFAGLEAKHEQNGVDDVGLAVAIGSNNTVKMVVKWTYVYVSVVGFEVEQLQLVNQHTLILCVARLSHI